MKTVWDKYHYDRQIIDEFLECFEIKIQGCSEQINWINTLSKILVWDGFNMDFNFDYSNLIKNRKSTFLKSASKWLISKSESRVLNKNGTWPNLLNRGTVLFFLKNKGEIEILLPILKGIKGKAEFVLVYEKDDTEKSYNDWPLYKLSNISFKPINVSLRLKKIPNKKALFVFNSFLREKAQIENYVSFFQTLLEKKQNLKKIVFVAGENKYVANFCHQLLKNTSITTENLMNGAKFGWVHDADVDFDTWYIWNVKMKDFLENRAGVPSDKLKIVGHPLEDQVKNHLYTNQFAHLNTFKTNFTQILVLFTSPRIMQGKKNIYKKIIDFVQQDSTMGLIIKAHPRDNDLEIFDKLKTNPQIIYLTGFSKLLTLDILRISTLTISFSSTVSFESVWMGVPNISYEEENDTLLPIGDELFFHINSTEELVPKIQALLKNNIQREHKDSNVSVVEKYVESILN